MEILESASLQLLNHNRIIRTINIFSGEISDNSISEKLTLECEKIFEIAKEDGIDILLKKRKKNILKCQK